MDWRDVHIAYEKPRRRDAIYEHWENIKGPEALAHKRKITTRYCETCRPVWDAVDRLNFPETQKLHQHGVTTGRMSAAQPNIANAPRGAPAKGQVLRILPTQRSLGYVHWSSRVAGK